MYINCEITKRLCSFKKEDMLGAYKKYFNSLPKDFITDIQAAENGQKIPCPSSCPIYDGEKKFEQLVTGAANDFKYMKIHEFCGPGNYVV